MININSELVCNIIAKIREFQAKEEVVVPEDLPDQIYETDWSQILADHQDDLTYQELVETIKDLEPDQQLTLIALGLIGRGDYEKGEMRKALDDASTLDSNQIVDFLLAIPLMADYLEEGLTQFGFDCEI